MHPFSRYVVPITRDIYHIIGPVVSNTIYNHSHSLQIMRATNLTSPTTGGGTLVLFLKKLKKNQNDLHVKFYDVSNGWHSEFKINDIHYQSAVMIIVPPYKHNETTTDVSVFVKLYVPQLQPNTSDAICESLPLTFVYTPSGESLLLLLFYFYNSYKYT